MVDISDSLAARGTPATSLPTFTTPSTLGTLGNTAGRVPARRMGQEATRQEFGREYLFRFWNKLDAPFAAASVWSTGDSNSTPGFTLGLALDAIATTPNMTVTNGAISGTKVSQFADGSNGFTAGGKSLAQMLTAGPDLLIIGFGTNDPFFGGTAESAAADLDAALTTIRGSANGAFGRLAIALVCPATQNDGIVNANTADMRDELYLMRYRPLVAALALKHKCAFFDRATRFPDAGVDFAAGMVGVNTWMDNARVHPQGAHRATLANDFYEWIIPAPYRRNLMAEVTPTAPFAKPGSIENMRVARDGRACLLEGYFTGPATTQASGTQVGVLPVGFRPIMQVYQGEGHVFSGTFPLENITLNVTVTGVITLTAATAQAVNRIYARIPFSAY